VYEASYLPFLFPSTSEEEQPPEATSEDPPPPPPQGTFKGRRAFGEHGKETTDKVLLLLLLSPRGSEQFFRAILS
jgi:hypothetical protein